MTIREWLDTDTGRVIIDAAESTDLCDPMRWTLYDGPADRVPEHLLSTEVLESGWSVGRETAIATILHPDKKRQRRP